MTDEKGSKPEATERAAENIAHKPNTERHERGDRGPSLGELVRNSNNEDAKRLKEEIDTLRKKRDKLISEIRSYKRTLNYKRDEYSALSKFLETETNKPDQAEISKLKKQKNRLEFKLSTEPRISLDQERDMVRMINEISTELNSKLRYTGLQKKERLLKGDIEHLSAKMDEVFKELNSMNEVFDKMYSDLKKMLGIREGETNAKRNDRKRFEQDRRHQKAPDQGINLEDIAVIKRKPNKKEEVDN